MKRFLFAVLAFVSGLSETFAAGNWLNLSDFQLRNGSVGFEDIPTMIMGITDFFLGIVGSATVVAIIYGAVRMGIGSLSNDKETGKKIITGSIFGFVLALSGWFVINVVINNL